MLPSRATIVLFAVGLLLIPVVVFFPSATWALFGFDGCILILFVVDALLAVVALRRHPLSVRRERPARLSLGVENEIVLMIENPGRRGQQIIVRDESPPGFPAEPILLPAHLRAHSWNRLVYRLLPTDRGNVDF